METEDNLTDGVVKSRPALTDVTNRLPKRPFSSISGDGGDTRFAKQLCLSVQDSVQSKCQLRHNDKGKSPSFTLPFCDNASSQNPNLPSHGIEEQNPLHCAVGSAPNESSVELEEIAEGRPHSEGFIANSIENDHLGSLACEVPTISASRDSKFLGLERCVALKGDGGGTSSVVADEDLKSCSCSFCLKAGYMLSDLYYQDAKGRISALKKSQKEASMIVQKLPAMKDSVTLDQQSSEAFQIELSLMHQWKSLFAYMENTFAQETSQLESSFEALKTLRENCKNDLELNKDNHFDNQ